MEHIRHFYTAKKSSRLPYSWMHPNGLICVNNTVYTVGENHQCTIIVKVEQGEETKPRVFVGYSMFNPADKNFNKKVGVEIARSNMRDIKDIKISELPKTIAIYYEDVIMEVLTSMAKKEFIKF